ncbi:MULTISPECIES: manganese catalase family protein [Paenibacillus]|uniref:manganese catalase family protein n=1 Tax=Paenibacillus TaxID=44249 RepID=UPI00073E183A|nr:MULTISPECIES: manganese catalase family protein [Paenibacillus]MDU4696367.1 manganese catalase family protein [Paenibacillus sp.]
MFFHIKELQYQAKPERPDPVYARKLQEALGGQFGEITVAMQYLFQGWNTRGDGKYRDLLLDTATEELAHVEMLATMIARLLDDAPMETLEDAAKDPVIAAILGGSNPQHAIVTGLGAAPQDSNGYPWNSRYTIASGNLLADFRANLNAESQGRLQVARLYEMTNDRGVKDMLSWLLARDTMHQNQWIAAIKELEAKEGGVVVPTTFPKEREKQEVSHVLFNFSRGEASATGPWAHGPSPDGATFHYVAQPQPHAPAPHLPPAPPRVYNTPPQVMKSQPNLPPM